MNEERAVFPQTLERTSTLMSDQYQELIDRTANLCEIVITHSKRGRIVAQKRLRAFQTKDIGLMLSALDELSEVVLSLSEDIVLLLNLLHDDLKSAAKALRAYQDTFREFNAIIDQELNTVIEKLIEERHKP